MGQKVNPISFRVGVFRNWLSSWFAPKHAFAATLAQDLHLRKFLDENLIKSNVAEVNIERFGESIRATIFCAKPGLVIGKGGLEIGQLKNQIEKKLGLKVDLSVKEVKKPDLSAQLIAASIAEQIEKRGNFKRLMKRAGFAVMKAGAMGVRIRCAGRLGGAEIARKEWFRQGSVPLHKIRANIDYAYVSALTTYGLIGIKVWICKGDF